MSRNMNKYNIETIEVNPYFDLEFVMRTSQENRIGGNTLERFASLWPEWSKKLCVRKVDTGKVTFLAVWLPEEVEESIDTSWAESPSQAYLDNALAQCLCMSAVHDILPEVEGAGCAPCPRPTDTLRAALQEAGIPYKDEGPTLSRRFAVVTHYPFKGACEICSLQANCPKGQGQAGAAAVVLPGYERTEL